MDRDQFVLGLAAVFAGLTVLLVVGSLASKQLLLGIVAVPFAIATYSMWYQASGRLAARARRSARGNPVGSRVRDTRFDGSVSGARRSTRGPRGSRDAGATVVTSGPTREEAYRTLGLTPGASPDAVRTAYRSKVKEVHPDTETGDEESFKRVKRAYETLTE